MAGLLESEGLTPDAAPLRDAAGECLGGIRTVRAALPDKGREYWGYEIADLRLNLETQRHCRPRKAVMRDISGLLSVRVEEYVPEAAEEVGAGFPLLRTLNTDFVFDVVLEVDGESHPLRSAWHIDTHPYTGTASRSVHPRFHYQIGGDKLDDIDDRIRGVFLPEAPRMPCAPLDGLLAIDFILSHYCGEHWALLRDLEPRYGAVRRPPMRRYWQPYYRELTDCIGRLDQPGPTANNDLHPNIY